MDETTMQGLAGALFGEATPDDGSGIQRERPDPAVQRKGLVERWAARVRADREHWEKKAFKQMRRDQAFAAGKQWPTDPSEAAAIGDHLLDDPSERYVANITLRHIKQATSAIYGKNPRIVARRRERLTAQIWDGSFASLQAAMASMQMGAMPDPNAMMTLMDAAQTLKARQQLDKMAKTLELLFAHEISEQALDFKVQMKATVRRALTTGVGYVKLGFQRVMKLSAEVEHRLQDMSQQLATIERLAADVADGEVATDSPEAEQLRLAMQALSANPDVLVREGLIVSYPDSTAVIPDKRCKQLRGFVGCNWVTEEFFLTGDEIKELYKKDLKGSGARAYRENSLGVWQHTDTRANDREGFDVCDETFCVWQIYSKLDGLVYTVCDGYEDFLEEPASPDVYMERFWPWFPLVFNEVYDDNSVFPPSDVSLMRDMQMDMNRARQGLREHRRASRPRIVTRAGILEAEDKAALEQCEAHTVIELAGLQPQEKVQDVLQQYHGSEIDPRLYDTSQSFEDILRVLGQHEANLGGTASGATATEVATAEGSRVTSNSSTVDDLDEFLAEFARAGGQILLREVSPDTVRQVVGPGALWPDLTREEIAKEIYLDVEAASTGRPNKAQEIQNAQQIMPILLQVPGINPEWIGRELIRRLDDRLDLSDAFLAGMPSIMAINRLQQMAPAQGGNDPNAQGAEGAGNTENPEPEQVNVAPRPPSNPVGRPPLTAGMQEANA